MKINQTFLFLTRLRLCTREKSQEKCAKATFFLAYEGLIHFFLVTLIMVFSHWHLCEIDGSCLPTHLTFRAKKFTSNGFLTALDRAIISSKTWIMFYQETRSPLTILNYVIQKKSLFLHEYNN